MYRKWQLLGNYAMEFLSKSVVWTRIEFCTIGFIKKKTGNRYMQERSEVCQFTLTRTKATLTSNDHFICIQETTHPKQTPPCLVWGGSNSRLTKTARMNKKNTGSRWRPTTSLSSKYLFLVFFDISWQLHQNTFTRFSAILPTDTTTQLVLQQTSSKQNVIYSKLLVSKATMRRTWNNLSRLTHH